MVQHHDTNSKWGPHLIGASTSGILEISLFHPVDTIGKRLMTNKLPIFHNRNFAEGVKFAHQIVLKESFKSSVFKQFCSLYPGVGYGAIYKVLQRTYKFAGQAIVKNKLKHKYGKQMSRKYGEKNGNDLLSACAGSMIGLGEVLLMPLDTLKVKAQTNPDSLKGRGAYDLFVRNGLSLYRGWNWTAMRNMPGSFLLFGVNSFVYSRCFGTTGPKDSTLAQIFCASTCGSVASIISTNPVDVIKTRVQHADFNDAKSGTFVLRTLIKEEGAGAFFKGLAPKTMLLGPKLVFSFFVAQSLTSRIQIIMEKKQYPSTSKLHLFFECQTKPGIY